MKPAFPAPPAGPRLRVRKLSVVIPLYNSEATVEPLVSRTLRVLRRASSRLELVLVNDGSRDGTHARAARAQARHRRQVKYLRLARNFGEHNAVMCGLRHATGDAVAIIDDDFQNPPEEIVKLVRKLAEGYDVVYSRYPVKHHHALRNLGSRFNDWVAGLLLAKPKGLYLSSFKVLSAFLAGAVVRYDGPFPYLDGLILRATHNIGVQTCSHAPRRAGRSNYTLSRLVRLWLNMLTGFSVVPLRVASLLGLGMATAGLLLAGFFVLSWNYDGLLFKRAVPPGWASLIVSLTVFGGIQLAVLGMIGEYLGRMFLTQNRVPQFVIRETRGVPG